MIVLELDQVEIDYCLGCSGIWLDAGELEILFGDPESARRTLEEASRLGEKESGRRRCPICGKRMEVIRAGPEGKVRIDRCRRYHGLWFDRGELEEILKAFDRDVNEKIGELLGNIFTADPPTKKEE